MRSEHLNPVGSDDAGCLVVRGDDGIAFERGFRTGDLVMSDNVYVVVGTIDITKNQRHV
ncbi:hypothetical protein PJI20_10290 [Mycobacterium kansasii]